MRRTGITIALVGALVACASSRIREADVVAGGDPTALHIVPQLGHGSDICRVAVAAAAAVVATIDCPKREGALVARPTGSLRVWDVQRRAVLAALPWNDGYEPREEQAFVGALALSADGRRLAVAGPTVQVFDVARAQLEARLLPAELLGDAAQAFAAVAFCADGDLVTGTSDGRVLRWRPGHGPSSLTDHQGRVAAVACDGRRWLSVGGDGDLRSGVLDDAGVHVWAGAGDVIAAAVDGDRAATVDASGVVSVWDVAGSGLLRRLVGRPAPWLGFAHGGAELRVGDGSRWDLATGEQRAARSAGLQVPLNDGALVVDGAGLAVVDNGGRAPLALPPDPLVSAVLSADGRVVATVQRSGLHVWSTELLQQQAVVEGVREPLAIADDGQFVAGVCDGAVCEVAAETGRIVARWALPTTAPALALRWRSDHVVVAAFADGAVVSVDLATGAQATAAAAGPTTTTRAWLAPQGRAVATLAPTVDGPDGTPIGPVAFLRRLPDGQGAQPVVVDGVVDATWYADGRHVLLQYPTQGLVLTVDEGRTVRVLEPTAGQGVRCVALSADGTRVAQGTGSGLLQIVDLHDGESRVVLAGHASPLQSLAWSRDGRLLMTAESDGGVRLWRFADASTDAAPTATVNLTSSGDEWAAWGDDGTFDSSRRGAALLGAVVDGRVYAVENEAARLNRPDLLVRRLGLAPPGALEHFQAHHDRRTQAMGASSDVALFEKAPTLALTSTAVARGSASLRLAVTLQRPGHVRWAVLDNGVLVAEGEEADRTAGAFDVAATVALTQGKNRVEAFVVDAAGAESTHDSLTLFDNSSVKRTLYVVAFGVSKYADPRLDLQYAHADALALGEQLQRAGAAFGAVVVQTLTDADVEPGAVDSVKGFLAGAQPQDTLVVFLAGHGTRSRDVRADFYFMSHGSDVNRIPETSIPLDQILSVMAQSAPRNRLLLLDACESGDADAGEAVAVAPAADQTPRGLPAELTRGWQAAAPVQVGWRSWRQRDRLIYANLQRRDGIIVLSSSRGSELSYESKSAQHGAFTLGVLEALRGAGVDVDGDQRLTVTEIKRHVLQRVPELTNGLQHPTLDRDNPLADLALPAVQP